MERWLSTRECADRLGVTTDFIVGEIRDGRLAARVMTRESGRPLYRIEAAAFTTYLARHWQRRTLSSASIVATQLAGPAHDLTDAR